MNRSNKLAKDVVELTKKYIVDVCDDAEDRDVLLWWLLCNKTEYRDMERTAEDVIYLVEVALELAPEGTTDEELALILHPWFYTSSDVLDLIRQTRIHTSAKQSLPMK